MSAKKSLQSFLWIPTLWCESVNPIYHRYSHLVHLVHLVLHFAKVPCVNTFHLEGSAPALHLSALSLALFHWLVPRRKKRLQKGTESEKIQVQGPPEPPALNFQAVSAMCPHEPMSFLLIATSHLWCNHFCEPRCPAGFSKAILTNSRRLHRLLFYTHICWILLECLAGNQKSLRSTSPCSNSSRNISFRLSSMMSFQVLTLLVLAQFIDFALSLSDPCFLKSLLFGHKPYTDSDDLFARNRISKNKSTGTCRLCMLRPVTKCRRFKASTRRALCFVYPYIPANVVLWMYYLDIMMNIHLYSQKQRVCWTSISTYYARKLGVAMLVIIGNNVQSIRIDEWMKTWKTLQNKSTAV